MKIIAFILTIISTISSASACGSIVLDQPFPYVSLESYGMDSAFNAITPSHVKVYTYDFSQCVSPESRGGSFIVDQKFPSVPLSEYGMDSWKVAK